MSEDKTNKEQKKKKKESDKAAAADKAVKITSDNKNAGAALAGANADVPAGEPDIDSGADDILEIIRRRKAAENADGNSDEPVRQSDQSSGKDDADIFDVDGLDRELPPPVRKGTRTKVVDRATFNEELDKAEMDKKRTITADKANNDAALGETFEDLRKSLAADAGTFDYRNKTIAVDKAEKTDKPEKSAKPDNKKVDIAERTDIDIQDYFYHEPEKKAEKKTEKKSGKKSGEKAEDKPEGKSEEKSPEDASAGNSGETGKETKKKSDKKTEKKSGKKSEKKSEKTDSTPKTAERTTAETEALLEELVAEEIAGADNNGGGDDADQGDGKRYGFKPYTRELRSLELAAAAQAEAEKEANSLSGKFKSMAKKRKKSSSGSSTSGSKSKASSGSKSGSGKGGQSKSASSKSRATKNSKTLANYKVSPNTTAFKLSDYQKSGKKSKSRKKTQKKKQKKWVGFVRAFFSTIILVALLGCIAGAGYTAYVVSHAPTIHPKNIYDTLDVSSHIYDDKENLIDEIYFSENRELATYDQLPENLKNAFIAVEDKTFWTHRGFNFKRIIGAILERFHGGRISGTSTITQQLARNVFLPDEKSVRSIKRKIIEMYYAYEIEQELSKEEIITAYLNTIYLGYGCYGVDTAAKTYFSSEVEDLTLEQCAALAALPQAPGSYSLLTNEPTDITTEYGHGVYINDASADRRNMILNLMYQQGMITEEEKEAATRPLEEFIDPGSSSSVSSTSAFKDYLIETIKKDLMEEYGIEEEQAVKIIYTKGLNIYTTLNSQAQEVVTKQFKKKDKFPSVAKGDGEVESACVITEVGTGEIKAMVGTRNVTGQMMFNRATNPRQPGSSIKPLAVYAPALERSLEYQKEGKIFKFKDTGYDRQGTKGWGDYLTVSSTVIDEPMEVEGRTWPLNVTRSYSGRNTFRSAIQKSINTCSVKILAQIGLEYSMDTVKRFGITSIVDDTSLPVNDYNLAALGLGAMTYGISPLEMSAAYAVFPNGGVRNTTICYTKVEDSGGRTLLESHSETVKVLDPGVAWIMTNVLQSVVSDGIAGAASVDGMKVGGKTGTTDDRYDIWFNGFTPAISVALWIGTDKNVAMDSSSEKAAALWSDIVSRVDIADNGEYPEMPDNVFRAWDGEYYTTGTAPEKPPEPDPEELKKEEEKKKKKEAAKKAAEAAKNSPAEQAAPAPAPAPAPAAETKPEG